MRLLVTGQSGVAADEVLGKFIANKQLFKGKAPAYLKVESAMQEIFLRRETEIKKLDDLWVQEVLRSPLPSLRTLWHEAFAHRLKELKTYRAAPHVLLGMHAVYYLPETVEYVSLHTTEVVKRFKPDAVVTLIDDVYDIHARLRRHGQIFCSANVAAPPFYQSVFQFLRLLDWRSKEILAARQIAHDSGVEHFVLATKHSQNVLDNILNRRGPKIYLSHPISQVRRLIAKEEKQKADEIIDAVEALEKYAATRVTLFSPTTIDELRIVNHGTANAPQCLPILTERWNEGYYKNPPKDILYSYPADAPEDPVWKRSVVAESSEKNTTISHSDLVNVVAEEINRQISARDHKLVEQSQALLVYRPVFCGNTSRGVAREIIYTHSLKRALADGRKLLIYCPTRDQADLRVGMLETHLGLALMQKKLLGLETGSFGFADGERREAINSIHSETAMVSFLKKLIPARKFYYPARGGLESDTHVASADLCKEIYANAVLAADKVLDDYKQGADIWIEDDNINPEKLVDLLTNNTNGQKRIKSPTYSRKRSVV